MTFLAEAEPSSYCHQCGESVLVCWRCQDCKMGLCTKCKIGHLNIPKLKYHRSAVVMITPRPETWLYNLTLGHGQHQHQSSSITDQHLFLRAELAQLIRWMTLNKEVPGSNLAMAI